MNLDNTTIVSDGKNYTFCDFLRKLVDEAVEAKLSDRVRVLEKCPECGGELYIDCGTQCCTKCEWVGW